MVCFQGQIMLGRYIRWLGGLQDCRLHFDAISLSRDLVLVIAPVRLVKDWI